MHIDGLVDFGGDESAQDVQAIEGHALLGGEGEEEINCFGVDFWREHVAETVCPFLISANYQSTFVFGVIPHRIEL